MQPALTQQQQQQGRALAAEQQLLLTAPRLSLHLLLIQQARQLRPLLLQQVLLILRQPQPAIVQLTHQQSALASSGNSSRLLQLSPAYQQYSRPMLTSQLRLAVLMCLQLQQHWLLCHLKVKLQLELMGAVLQGQRASPVSTVGHFKSVGQVSTYKQLQKGPNQAGMGASHQNVLLHHWQRCCKQC
jgi:hypothetical protein